MRPQSLYLGDILSAADQVAAFVHDLDYAGFLSHAMAKSAVVWQLVIVGEAARSISPDLREAHPDVPWKLLSGMRNRLAHAYFGIDYEIVWEVAHRELPEFRRRVKQILDSLDGA